MDLGIGAALLMSSLHAAVRAHWGRGRPAWVMGELNAYLCENTPPEKFVTLFYAEINTATATLTYSNAGQNLPVVLRASGAVGRLEAGGTPCGLFQGATYHEASLSLGPGDIVVAWSDGLTEGTNASGEEPGEEPLLAALRATRGGSAAEIRDAVLAGGRSSLGGQPAADDTSVVVICRGLSS